MARRLPVLGIHEITECVPANQRNQFYGGLMISKPLGALILLCSLQVQQRKAVGPTN